MTTERPRDLPDDYTVHLDNLNRQVIGRISLEALASRHEELRSKLAEERFKLHLELQRSREAVEQLQKHPSQSSSGKSKARSELQREGVKQPRDLLPLLKTEESRQKLRAPASLGQFLVCLFVPVDRQIERLGDMEEMFSTTWVPKFGPFWAQFVYTFHALRCAARLVKGAAVAAVVDRLLNVLHRVH